MNQLTVSHDDLTTFGPEKIDLIKRTVCKGATNDELSLFIHVCKKSGLDPFARQIYAVRRKGQMTIQTGIDGYRLIADRTGQYAGNEDPIYNSEEKPTKATTTVYKMIGGTRCPFTATARWDQYYPGPKLGFMWSKMPHLMLGKCAEALALRKAFPGELSGLYTKEEMDQAGPETTEDIKKQSIPVDHDVIVVNYEKREFQLSKILTCLKELTSKMELEDKVKFLKENCGVLSFKDLSKKNNDELDIIIKNLSSKTVTDGIPRL